MSNTPGMDSPHHCCTLAQFAAQLSGILSSGMRGLEDIVCRLCIVSRRIPSKAEDLRSVRTLRVQNTFKKRVERIVRLNDVKRYKFISAVDQDLVYTLRYAATRCLVFNQLLGSPAS